MSVVEPFTTSNGDITIYAGEVLTVEIQIADVNGNLVDLSGRSFALTAFDAVDRAVLESSAATGVSDTVTLAFGGTQTEALYTDSLTHTMGVEIVEQLTGGVSQFSEGTLTVLLRAAGGATTPPTIEPDAPVISIYSNASKNVIISQRGASGLNAAQVAALAGQGDGTPESFFAAVQAPALEAAAAAQGVVDAQAENIATVNAAVESTATYAAGTHSDLIVTTGNRLQTGIDRTAAESASGAADAAAAQTTSDRAQTTADTITTGAAAQVATTASEIAQAAVTALPNGTYVSVAEAVADTSLAVGKRFYLATQGAAVLYTKGADAPSTLPVPIPSDGPSFGVLTPSGAQAMLTAALVAIAAPTFGFVPGTTDIIHASVQTSDGSVGAYAGTDGVWKTFDAEDFQYTPIPGVVRRPTFGFAPGTTDLIIDAEQAQDGSLIRIASVNETFTPGNGDWIAPVGYSRVPTLGFLPGSTAIIDRATFNRDATISDLGAGDATVRPDAGGWIGGVSTRKVPTFGFLPNTTEIITRAEVGSDDSLLSITGDGSAGDTAALQVATPTGLKPVAGTGSGGNDIFVEPATFDAGNVTSLVVPAGSIPMGGELTTSWGAVSVATPATSSVTNQTFNSPAANGQYPMFYEVITSYSVTAASGGAPVDGVDYTVDSRGNFNVLTGRALTITYTGNNQRSDLVYIDPRSLTPAPLLASGTEKPRNAHLYTPAVPAGCMAIGRTMTKGNRRIFIPTWRYRNGIRVDRWAEDAAALEWNRRILAPFIRRLAAGLPVAVVCDSTSRGAMGNNGNYAALNHLPNSGIDTAGGTGAYYRDHRDFWGLYTQADRALFGFDDPNLLIFNGIPGYNLTGGSPDGIGAYHIQRGYTWELLRELHRMFPTTPISYFNHSIGGTDSSATIGTDGLRANALYPTRHNAVLATITAQISANGPGSVLYIPIDPMNEPGNGGQDSYDNWKILATDAQAAGAVVHFFGNARPDPRFNSNQNTAAYQALAREQSRVAWDTGSAISDSWSFDGPANICALGLFEDNMMDNSLSVHEGVPLSQALGRDAARSYTL